VSLYDTSGNFDSVNGSGAAVVLNAAEANVVGGYDIVWTFGASTVRLSGTAGAWDIVFGSGAQIALNDAQASIVGGGNTITATAGSTASLPRRGGWRRSAALW
jgi:hypothetical protein